MNVLRRRINPETFVITRQQLAKYLKLDQSEVSSMNGGISFCPPDGLGVKLGKNNPRSRPACGGLS